MKLVILESPYAGDIEANVAYARAAVRDSLMRGEAPMASHLLYTQPGVLRDEIPVERQHGIDAGLAWRKVAEKTVVYLDRGLSTGMLYGIRAAAAHGLPVEYRYLYNITTGTLARALKDVTDRYIGLVDSGDCGNWNPRTEPFIELALEVLSIYERQDKKPTPIPRGLE